MSQVFISYRHSDTHSPRVADLVKALRAAGVNVVIDSDQLPAGPNEGWPKWSQQQVHLADKVLIACTTGWRECYETTKTLPAGLGSAAEAHMIHQELYDKAFINEKFRVVLLDAEDEESIPKSLKAYQAYRYYLPEGEDLLLAWLGATRNKNPVVNWPVLSAHFERQLANRDAEFETLKTMLKGKHTQQALLIHGASGLGKTTLINEFRVLASHLGIDDTFVDCKITADLASALQLMQIMGFNPNSNKLIGVQRRALMVELKRSRQPHLLILDALDSASEEIKHWLINDILSRLRYYPGLIVCVCSQQPMQYSKTVWEDKAVAFELKPILDPEAWLSICKENPDASTEFIKDLLKFTCGQPKLTSEVLLKNHGLASSSTDWSQR